MKPSQAPVKKTNEELGEFGRLRVEPRRARYAYEDSPEFAGTPPYHSLLDYWHILLRHKMVVLCFGVAGLLLAALISCMQTPIFRARTSLEVQDFNENFLDLQNVEPTNSTGSYATAQSYFETQVKILQSESVLERVIDGLNLTHTAPARTKRSLFRRIFGTSAPVGTPNKDALVQQAENNLTVRSVANSRLLEVLYQSEDPKIAADFANTLVSEFIRQSQEMRWQSAQRTGEWLTSHLDEMKARLEQSEAQLQAYARDSGLTFTSENDNVSDIRVKELQDELSKAQADRLAKQAKFDEAKNKRVESLPEVLDDPILRDHRLKLTDLQKQLAELNETLTPAHYKVQRVRVEIAQLQSSLDYERGLILGRIANEYDAARRREQFLASAYAEQQKIVAEQSNKVIHYNTLKREVDSSRQLYQAMLQRVKQAELATTMRASNVLVVDAAKIPLFPYKPNLQMNSIFGLVTGMFLGVAFVFVRAKMDHRICAPGDAEVCLNLPELGVLPKDASSNGWQIANGWRRPRFDRLIPLSSTTQTELDDCPELATWKRKPSLFAECARTALTSILLPTNNGGYPRVVVLTSPSAGDGKTTVATNLSIAMADIGRRVLLIDADLRRPRLHKVFAVENDRGFIDALWADTPVERISVEEIVRQTKIPGLCVLPAGSINTGVPFHLLHSPRLAGLLTRFRNEFDMVMIDAPPMIHLADARLLGRLADGVILVIRAGQTSTESASFVIHRFLEDGTRVLGTILNSWDPKSTPGYGYRGYPTYAEL